MLYRIAIKLVIHIMDLDLSLYTESIPTLLKIGLLKKKKKTFTWKYKCI